MSNNVEFINESGLEFKNLDSEEYRVYEFADGAKVRIDAPLKLNVSTSGGHRIFDKFEECHYIPAGWVHLSWRVKPGRAHFDF
jgi:hypothetical protein